MKCIKEIIDNYNNLVTDGTYRIDLEETWALGTTHTAKRYFSFTKKSFP